jgi:hypothetical protein
MTLPRKLGLTLAGLHFLLVVGVAVWILTHIHQDPMAPTLWFLVDILDLPIFLLTIPLGPWIQSLPHVSWLPGIAGAWEPFLFSLLEGSILGTAWWFLIGWGVGRIWISFRPRT